MRRVLLLVCLIVSLVELDWERGRIYLFSSVASFLLVLYSELMRRRRIQSVGEGVFKTGQDIVPSEVYVSGSLPADNRAQHIENGPPSAAIQGVVLMQDNSP